MSSLKTSLGCCCILFLVGCSKSNPLNDSSDKSANKLFVEAVELVQNSQKKRKGEYLDQDISGATRDLGKALGNLRKIIKEYPGSNIAVRLAAGEKIIGELSISQIERNFEYMEQSIKDQKALKRSKAESEQSKKMLVRTLKGHGSDTHDGINKLAWSADGKNLMSASLHKLRIWNTVSGSVRFEKSHIHLFTKGVAWDSQHKRIAFPSDSFRIIGGRKIPIDFEVYQISQTQKPKLISLIQGYHSWTSSVTWSSDGKLIASGDKEGNVKIWKWENDKLVHSLKCHKYTRLNVSYNPSGKKIAVSSRSGFEELKPLQVQIFDTASGKLIRVLKGHTDFVRDNNPWSPDGKLLVTITNKPNSSTTDAINIWSTTDGKLIHEIHVGDYGLIGEEAVWSPSGKLFANSFSSKNPVIRIWDMNSGKIKFTLAGHADQINCVDWSPNGEKIATGSDDGSIKIWSAIDGTLIHSIRPNWSDTSSSSVNFTRVAWSSDSRRIAAEHKDWKSERWINIWMIP